MQHLLKVILLSLAMFIAACGQQGALYFPEQEAATDNVNPESTMESQF